MIQTICKRFDEVGRLEILRAYEIATSVLDGETRSNKHPFIEHPLAVAKIVSEELMLGSSSIAAVFLHEASRNNPGIIETHRGEFRRDIIDITLGLNKISQIKPRDTKLEAEVYRRLIASYSNDPRVFLIKLADRLEIMRNLYILSKSDQVRKNLETILLYVPLAHQTGIYSIKSELEDLYLRYAEPDKYREITNYLKSTEKEREILVRDFVEPLKDRLSAKGINYHLKARTKSAYSIWRKMQVQGVSIKEVYDIFAIRFIINTPLESELSVCWDVYSLVTEKYKPDTKRLRDWLTTPKPNGYQSLHTTVQNDRGQYIEVQIRTERMDYNAEIGFASHASYKGIKQETAISEWLSNVRNLMQQSSYSEYEQIAPSVLQDVFVFTPDGELRQLHAGATVLDFAFNIHSNIGLHCTGAKIGGRMVPIKEPLKTGEIVEILTSKTQKPTRDWLNFVTTSKARGKIKQYLAQIENKQAQIGKELLDRRLRNWKMEIADDEMAMLIKKYKRDTANQFFSDLGNGTIDISDIKTFITELHDGQKEVRENPEIERKKREDSKGDDVLVIGKGLKNIDYKMAKCCNPVFGDEVFGFVTIKEGIKIHRMSCPNAARLLNNYSHRVQKVKWKDDSAATDFQTTIKIGADQESVTNNIISTISAFKSSIRSFNVTENGRKGIFDIVATLYVPNIGELDKIMASLKKIKGVKQVTRL
ncbi:MAG: bifunctional (p)ppGpp synthetase/guanosine-3',5'-bis(diphosphate) 3'-pyrophosphohydrolase [Bacteroidales bacterium]|nr:bifunctional (p)ppGpp synthetase/guanosine-3',5'-bis(diphosphate) 3'-pyrophosphohydrolase [Bacteroidales bacterium]